MNHCINLTQDWVFLPDVTADGEDRGLYARFPSKNYETVSLPHIWQQHENKLAYDIAYYYNSFKLDPTHTICKLQFESVYHFVKVWVNGNFVGEHLGGGQPFELDISSAVTSKKENTIAVKVEKPNCEKMLQGFTLRELPVGPLLDPELFGGITGFVCVKSFCKTSVYRVLCFPDYEANQVTVETHFFCDKKQTLEVEFCMTNPKGTRDVLPKFVQATSANMVHNMTFRIPEGEAWELNDPKMYTMEVRIKDSSIIQRFGLRRVETEKSVLKLNHQLRVFKGVQFKQKFPFSYTVAPSFQKLQEELSLLKESGFNIIRSGNMPLSHNILNICDELGIMVIQETTCFDQKSSKVGYQWFKTHIQNMVFEYHNHPCIVAWGMGSDNGSMTLENGNKLLKFTSSLDPFRPVISNFNSVFLDSNDAEQIDRGRIFSPIDMKVNQFESHRFYIAFPIRTKTENFLIDYGSHKNGSDIKDDIHGRKSFWEKYNYIKSNLQGKILIGGLGAGVPTSMDDLLNHKEFKKLKKHPQYQILKNYYKQLTEIIKSLKLWKTPAQFFEDCSTLIEESILLELSALVANPQISGYMFESWSDEDFFNKGLTNILREPKPLLKAVAKFQNTPKIIPQFVTRTPYYQSHFEVKVSLLVEDLASYKPIVTIRNARGKVIGTETFSNKKGSVSLMDLDKVTFPLKKEIGKLTCHVGLEVKGKIVTEREVLFYVQPEIDIDKVLRKIDFRGVLSPFVNAKNQPKAKLIVVNQIEKLNKKELGEIHQRVKAGAKLILSPLQDHNIEQFNQLKWFKKPLSMSYCAWAEGGSYHFSCNKKIVPNATLLGTEYADILPQWSLSLPTTHKKHAGCLNLYAQRIEQETTLGTLPLGKGSVTFCQFHTFELLGQHALVDNFFSNLVNAM